MEISISGPKDFYLSIYHIAQEAREKGLVFTARAFGEICRRRFFLCLEWSQAVFVMMIRKKSVVFTMTGSLFCPLRSPSAVTPTQFGLQRSTPIRLTRLANALTTSCGKTGYSRLPPGFIPCVICIFWRSRAYWRL